MHHLVRIGDESVRMIEKEGDEEIDFKGNGFDYQSGYEYQLIEWWITEFCCQVSWVVSDDDD